MDIFQHFRKEEQPFIEQVLAWKEEVETYYVRKLTDFLDPREQYICESIIGKNQDVQLHLFGGKEPLERKRAILAPYYEEISKQDFELVLLSCTYPQKFVQITHRDVLGAVMSAGVKRQKIGDIIVHDGIIQLICDETIASYLKIHFNQIKNSKIQWKEESFERLIFPKHQWHENQGTVSSLRLDAVLKEMYRISRSQAVEYISKGFIKVNFKLVENPSFQMEEGDIISFRKKGRSKIVKINGKTKKDKVRITFAMLK